MAIVFFGTPQFAVPSLKALINEKEDIAFVVTQPDRIKGRGHTLSAPPVKEVALSLGLKVLQPESIRDETFYMTLKDLAPEFIIVVAYGKILPEKILALPKFGCINVHASLLPKFRGAAPIQWALIKGEKITGVTTMLMDKGLDTGDILLKAELDISDDDTSETLSIRLSELGAELLIKTIKGIRDGKIKPEPQKGEVSYAPPLKKDDGRINWEKSAEELFNFIRGMNPWPSAYSYLNGERIKIIKARKPIEYDISLNGKAIGIIVKASDGQLIVQTGSGLLAIEELQPEGKKTMSAKAFLAGRKLKEGYDRFS